jgi:uncharacterized protein (TIGR03000 family)
VSGPTTTKATVVVKLPADAKLFAENQILALTSAERSFVTPDLPTGREFTYTFRIEYDRNGRTLSESQKVTVVAGRTANVVFDDLVATTATKTSTATSNTKPEAAKSTTAEKPDMFRNVKDSRTAPAVEVTTQQPARITVKLPDNAMLYIDGKQNDGTDKDRVFTTPPLPPGREYTYVMSIQTQVGGQVEQLHQKVVFKAGEIVRVDFTEDPRERKASK